MAAAKKKSKADAPTRQPNAGEGKAGEEQGAASELAVDLARQTAAVMSATVEHFRRLDAEVGRLEYARCELARSIADDDFARAEAVVTEHELSLADYNFVRACMPDVRKRLARLVEEVDEQLAHVIEARDWLARKINQGRSADRGFVPAFARLCKLTGNDVLALKPTALVMASVRVTSIPRRSLGDTADRLRARRDHALRNAVSATQALLSPRAPKGRGQGILKVLAEEHPDFVQQAEKHPVVRNKLLLLAEGLVAWRVGEHAEEEEVDIETVLDRGLRRRMTYAAERLWWARQAVSDAESQGPTWVTYDEGAATKQLREAYSWSESAEGGTSSRAQQKRKGPWLQAIRIVSRVCGASERVVESALSGGRAKAP